MQAVYNIHGNCHRKEKLAIKNVLVSQKQGICGAAFDFKVQAKVYSNWEICEDRISYWFDLICLLWITILMAVRHQYLFQGNCGMLNVGKTMLCVYRAKPNASTSDRYSLNDGPVMSEKLLSRESKRKVTVKIRLFPRESQPCSSTRWWTVTLKAKSVFRRNKHNVRITENVGTRTFTSTEGKFSRDEENVIVRGQLEDDSVAGGYFLLRLKQTTTESTCATEDVLYEGTLARSKDLDKSEDCWEITHDAVVFRNQCEMWSGAKSRLTTSCKTAAAFDNTNIFVDNYV